MTIISSSLKGMAEGISLGDGKVDDGEVEVEKRTR